MEQSQQTTSVVGPNVTASHLETIRTNDPLCPLEGTWVEQHLTHKPRWDIYHTVSASKLRIALPSDVLQLHCSIHSHVVRYWGSKLEHIEQFWSFLSYSSADTVAQLEWQMSPPHFLLALSSIAGLEVDNEKLPWQLGKFCLLTRIMWYDRKFQRLNGPCVRLISSLPHIYFNCLSAMQTHFPINNQPVSIIKWHFLKCSNLHYYALNKTFHTWFFTSFCSLLIVLKCSLVTACSLATTVMFHL